jgi:hypothetical protein
MHKKFFKSILIIIPFLIIIVAFSASKRANSIGVLDETYAFRAISPVQDDEYVDPSTCEFKWEEVKDAKKYRLVISEDEDLKKVVFDDFVEQSNKTVKGLKPATTYYWKITAILTDVKGKEKNMDNKDGIRMFKTGLNNVSDKEMTPQMIREKWNLTFEDDFDGDKIDDSKWSHCPEWERKDGFWSNEDAYLDGEGNLIIRVDERDGKYYSGAIRSMDKFEQKQGFFEIRCKLQTQEGFWGAFWLMSPTVAEVGDEGRDGTEIDIMESAYLKSSKICQALHWDGYEDDHKSDSNIPYIPYIYEGYHTFAVNWD